MKSFPDCFASETMKLLEWELSLFREPVKLSPMILLANSMRGIAAILGSVIFIAEILIIARVVVSWLNADPRNRLVEFIVGSTEPMLLPIRRRLPLIAGAIDLSPIVLLFALLFLKYALVDSLNSYALRVLSGSAVPIHTTTL